MHRLSVTDATQALIEAMERAEHMEHVIIVYQTKREFGSSPGGYVYGVVQTGHTEVASANWLIDVYKQWLLNSKI